MLFGGMAHRRAEHVSKQVDELGEQIEAVEDQLRQAEERPSRPPVPGMPLPTGYGLQVKGPASEDILIPVCLPPGFELGSLVLKPSFLPEEEHAAAHGQQMTAAEAQAPAALVGSAAPAAAPPAGDRLGEAIQLVYTEESGFRTGGEGLVSRPPAVVERDASLL